MVDASAEEEECASCRLSVAVNCNGQIVAMQKFGSGSIKPSLLQHAIQNCRRLAVNMITTQNQLINNVNK